MVYKVEMMWGESQYMMVYDMDEDGELRPGRAEKIRDEPDPEYRYHSCGCDGWDRMVELGVQFGWQQAGTSLDHIDPNSKDPWAIYAKPDYQPVDWVAMKRVTAEDAANWADALERALPAVESGQVVFERTRPVILSQSMTIQDHIDANASLNANFIRRFVAFLRKGTFLFTYDE